MGFSDNLTLLIRTRKVKPQWLISEKVYGVRTATRNIRRLMNDETRVTLEVVIKYARVLNVDASDLAFGTDGVFNPYVDVENRFCANMRLYQNKYPTHILARKLYPNKRVVDVNDGRKLLRLAQGYTRPRMDDIMNLANGLGVSPSKLAFGVL